MPSLLVQSTALAVSEALGKKHMGTMDRMALNELEKAMKDCLSLASGKCERQGLRQQIQRRISSPTAAGRKAEAQARASVTQTAELQRKVSSPI